jgi:hypothetical protein
MAVGNWNLEFLNHNSQRSYPLATWGNKVDTSGAIRIPDALILALDFPIHSGITVDPSRFFIRQLAIYPTGINVSIGYDNLTAAGIQVASVNVANSSHTEYRSYAVPGSDAFDDSVGRIVFGDLSAIADFPIGVFNFLPSATPIEVSAIRPMIRGVSSVTVVSGGSRSVPLYGDIEFRAGANFRITVNQADTPTPEIVFSAISGEGLNDVCGCDDDTSNSTPIRFINGIPPLPNGNYRILGDDCLRVKPITNGLQLEDVCSKPCCGCNELEALINEVKRFSDGATTLQTFAATLSAEVTQMSQVVLGSRLGTNVCVDC